MINDELCLLWCKKIWYPICLFLYLALEYLVSFNKCFVLKAKNHIYGNKKG
jgi:hypothetical protein